MLATATVEKPIQEDLKGRVISAITTFIASAARHGEANPALVAVELIAEKKGNWREALRQVIFQFIVTDMRLAMVPFALAESLPNKSLSNENLGFISQTICNIVSEGREQDDDHAAFAYIVCLLTALAMPRPYTLNDRWETEDWLRSAFRNHLSHLKDDAIARQLARFQPFLANPVRFETFKDPVVHIVHNTLVAAHSGRVMSGLEKGHDFDQAKHFANLFFDSCYGWRQ